VREGWRTQQAGGRAAWCQRGADDQWAAQASRQALRGRAGYSTRGFGGGDRSGQRPRTLCMRQQVRRDLVSRVCKCRQGGGVQPSLLFLELSCMQMLPPPVLSSWVAKLWCVMREGVMDESWDSRGAQAEAKWQTG